VAHRVAQAKLAGESPLATPLQARAPAVPSSRTASSLMILPPEKLTAKQKQQLEHMCQASSDLFIAYHLSQDFVTLLKERQADPLHE
jgi:hypothetical protein